MLSRLLFVEANTTGTGMLALDTTRRLGLEPVFLTGDPGRYGGLDEARASIVRCDTNSIDALRRTVAELSSAGGSGPIVGVTTTSDFYLQLVADLAQSLGLPGNPPQVLRRCRDKAAVRRVLAAAGVDQPRFAEVRAPGEVAAAVDRVGLPCVVKPVDDSGSNNVRICATRAEVQTQVAAVLAGQRNARGQAMAAVALLEQYVSGPEFSVEMFSVDGVAGCVGITRKHVTGPPFCVETGHRFPADLDPADVEALTGTTRRLLDALGVRLGPTHTELRLGPDGPAVIEINCRLAGGMIPELVRLATGTDLIEQQLRCAIGQRPSTGAAPTRWTGIRFLTAARPGVFQGATGVEAVAGTSGVVQASLTMRPGTAVGEPRNAYDRIGYVIAAGGTPGGVDRSLAAADLIELDLGEVALPLR